MGKFAWLKKLVPVARVAGDVLAITHPELEPLVEIAQAAIPRAKAGADRKELVTEVSDQYLDAFVAAGTLTPDKATEIRALRSEAIDAIVTAKNAEQAASEAVAQFNALIADIKAAA